MEFFYQDALRWSYGFDNPNKAAVLWACALPLAWAAWTVMGRRRPVARRWAASVLGAVVVLGVAFLLFKTYSRGGAVAGMAGVAYVVGRTARGPGARPLWSHALLGLGVMAVFFGVGLGARSIEPLREGGDASVENRITLWRAALRMAVDRPGGFGAGNSGSAYMNWYQPLEMTAAYRTMVNSYLTALVEWGWAIFVPLALLAGFAWSWADPGRSGSSGRVWAAGLRGAVLAFAVAGGFSTTMEDGRLWVLPGLCAAGLITWTAAERRSWRAGLPGAAGALGVCVVLFAGGLVGGNPDGLRRAFDAHGNVSLVPSAAGKVEPWEVISSRDVFGDVSGKLLRALATTLGESVVVSAQPRTEATRLIVAGEGVRQVTPPGRVEQLVLLAPAEVSVEQARQWIGAAKRVRIFVPEIDEDGRADFWRSVGNADQIVVLEGVGVRVDWVWSDVIEELKTDPP